ncbi:hypothetical protein [Azospirillum sp. sgz301742]
MDIYLSNAIYDRLVDAIVATPAISDTGASRAGLVRLALADANIWSGRVRDDLMRTGELDGVMVG